MSSTYSKRGYRKYKISKAKDLKKAYKSWEGKVRELNSIAMELSFNPTEITEENINTYVRPYLGRDVDDMEKLLILGQIEQFKLSHTYGQD